MAEIDGDDTDNTLNGSNGQDTIRGFDGNDSINGRDGNDTIYGGDGDDTITGGRGDDLIVGGRGNDTMSAGSGSPTDTFVIRDGDGQDTITDFDPGEPDIIDFRMAEMSSFSDVTARMTQDGPDTVITYDNGDFVRLQNVNSNSLTATNFTFNSGPICFHKGTRINTATGPRRVEDLRLGDAVITADHGLQIIRYITCQTVHFSGGCDAGKPVLIKAGALGPRTPDRDTVVSPQHRIVIHDPVSNSDVFVVAKKLARRAGIRQMSGRNKAFYYNILFDHHEVIVANGIAAESLLVTAHTLRAAPNLAKVRTALMAPARRIVEYDPATVQNLHAAA